MPWNELGLALCLSGVLGLMAQLPVPLVSPAEVEDMEGRTVRVAGTVDDVQIGLDSHRGALVADGQAVRFHADGTEPPEEGAWVELRGTLRRDNGWLILEVEPEAWTW